MKPCMVGTKLTIYSKLTICIFCSFFVSLYTCCFAKRAFTYLSFLSPRYDIMFNGRSQNGVACRRLLLSCSSLFVYSNLEQTLFL
ncbi:hypothetical protein HanIR_Chr12g0601331 [Helianthus annuus]|nr:hypothetical protein HanIR_Chr12g0601331 [Helianthus annuus]